MSAAPDPTESMRARLQGDLRLALKARAASEVGVLRRLIGALDNAGAITAPPTTGPARVAGSGHVATGLAWGDAEATRRSLTCAQVDALIEREAAALRGAAAQFDRLGRDADAKTARSEAAIADRYRP